MTDRQKEIEIVLDIFWSEVTVRHCVRHIFANLRKKHPDVVYRSLFWATTRSMLEKDWNNAIEQIRLIKTNCQGAF